MPRLVHRLGRAALKVPLLQSLLRRVEQYWQHVSALAEESTNLAAWFANRLMWTCALGVALCLIVSLTFVFALVQYTALYWLLVPKIHIDKPVYFDFHPQSSIHPHSSVELPGDMPGTSISIATAAIAGRPVASVSLVGPQWASTHVTADAYPPNPTSLLASQQAYRLELQMNVPDSPANHELGMVQVSIEFMSASNEVLATSSRPVALKYEHSLIRHARRLLLCVPLMLGLWSEEQHLSVILFEDFVEHPEHRATSVRLSLSHPILVYEAHLHFRAELSGIRRWLHYWFPISFPLFVVSSMFWQLVLVAAAAYSMRDSVQPTNRIEVPFDAQSAGARLGEFTAPLPTTLRMQPGASASSSQVTNSPANTAVSFVMPAAAPAAVADVAPSPMALADRVFESESESESDGLRQRAPSA